MIISEGLPFINEYVDTINAAIKIKAPEQSLTRLQCYWLSFIILGILVTNTVCWKKIERYSLTKYSASAISWMFRQAKIAWECLLFASTMQLIAKYNIKVGTLVIDDSDIERAKNTSQIGLAHKIKNKKSGGFFNGQNVIFLLLVTKEFTIPVGFKFYAPNPKMTAWRKEDRRLREKKVAKKYRPPMPEVDPDYPSKVKVALGLLKTFTENFVGFKIKAVLADCLYSTKEFIDNAVEITGQRQIITQIKQTQLINVNGTYQKVEKFFNNYSGKIMMLNFRGQDKKVTFCGGKFGVKSLDKKYYVIAIKYENEEEFRYLIAHDSSWRDVDIIERYSLRWLVEVFIQDWKSYEGWDNMAKQPGIDGSERGLTLSLLCDHALLVHKEQELLFKNQESAATVGSLRERIMMESLVSFIETVVQEGNPKEILAKLSAQILDNFKLNSSDKHLRHSEMVEFSEAA